MKLEPLTKLDKRNTATSNKMTSLSFFPMQLSGSRIPDTCCINFTFSLRVNFYLTELENRTKKHSSYFIALSKGTIIAQKILIFLKK